MNFIYVGLGGAAGAMLRYGISQLPWKGTFPVLTLITNLIGAFFIGVIAGAAEKKGLSASTVLFLKTGLCGGFTTFSTFSLESVTLLEQGRIGMAGGYMIASVVLCLVGVAGGLRLGLGT